MQHELEPEVAMGMGLATGREGVPANSSDSPAGAFAIQARVALDAAMSEGDTDG
jgi:hypothetical protein